MNITFIKQCVSIKDSGWSAYNIGDEATLKGGANLVAAGIAREGWGEVEQAALVPDLSPSRKVLASRAVRKRAADENLLIYSVVGTGKNGRVTMADVEALIE